MLVLSHGAGDNVAEELIREAAEGNFKELVDEVVSKVITNMTTGEAVVVREEVDVLAGKITINRNETAMHLLISSLIGRCWRKSISTAWLS